MKPHHKYALHLALAHLLFQAILDVAYLHDGGFLISFGNMLIITGATYLAMREVREQQGGFLKFGAAYRVGLKTALLGGLLSAVGYYIFLKFVFHRAVSSFYRTQWEDILAKELEMNVIGKEAYDKALSNLDLYAGPGSLSIVYFTSIVFSGLMFCLVAALLARRENPDEPMPYK